jgi:bacterioferritin
MKASDNATDGRKPFLSDIKEIRRRARQHIQAGAVTEGYRADRETVLRLLNEALATEIVCVLRYRRHHYTAAGIHAQAVAQEFLEHANEEQGHADLIAERIVQLGGEPDFNPEGLMTRSHSEYSATGNLLEMIHENLVAERIAIESYGEIIRYLGDDDPTSRRMMEEILATEEEHAEDLRMLIQALGERGSAQTGDGHEAKGNEPQAPAAERGNGGEAQGQQGDAGVQARHTAVIEGRKGAQPQAGGGHRPERGKGGGRAHS